MWLPGLAWKNIWRNKSRTLISMLAIFFAVILSVVTSSLQDGVFDHLVNNMVSLYSGYLQIHKQGYWDEQVIDNSLAQSDTLEQQMLANREISAFSPRLESFALASSEALTKGCLIVGVSPAEENQITRLQDKVMAGEYLVANDKGVLLAQGLADRLHLALHDTIILIGQGYHGATAAGKYVIKGIVRFGSPDLNDRILYMSLPNAWDLFEAQGQLTSYVIALHNNSSLQAVAAQLQQQAGPAYEVMTWENMMPDVVQHIRTDTATSKIYLAILYMLIGFGIFGTLLMMMSERKFEMGMMVAIGMQKGRLAILLVFELLFTIITGCLIGLLASIPIVYWLNSHPIRFSGELADVFQRFGFEPIFPASIQPVHFYSQGLIVLLIGLVLALYPLSKIIRLKPVNAMKR